MISSLLLPVGQNFGHETEEFHVPITIEQCSKSGGCQDQSKMVTMDSNWRWTHKTGTTNNCYTGNLWNQTYCPDDQQCTQNCAIDGVDEKTWKSTYGVEFDKQTMLNMSFVTKGEYSRNVGSRTYLMDDDDNYMQFKLLNKEFTFTTNVANMPCGLNAALYFVEMDKDGGKSKYGSNQAGAKLGTGYCDAQCPHDLKWINGEANNIDWVPSKTDINAGTGKYGTCCAELDIWEANAISTQMTVHNCLVQGQTRCEGIMCGDNDKHQRFNGTCDKDGCDFNPYRVGATDFYGPGPAFKVNTDKDITVVTQFITDDGTDNGKLKEMRRLYVQDGKVIANPTASYGNYDSISNEQCTTQKNEFTDVHDFEKKGGMEGMGEAMGRGLTLVMSMWDDHDVGMIWLDATDPYPVPAGKKGAPRGTCNQTSGDPKFVEKMHPHSNVIYKNIKYGEIGSTYSTSGPSPPTPPSGCPGGSLSSCIGLCPADPSSVFEACVKSCSTRCSSVPTPSQQQINAMLLDGEAKLMSELKHLEEHLGVH